MTKSSEAIWDLLRAQASMLYKSTGTHLLLISCIARPPQRQLCLFYRRCCWQLDIRSVLH